ncbi:MAG: adenylosuccinate synthase [Candidatus Diapherotrites archaeon]|nr:adenylosuccinate synthase [Candidatus Diapherotrites archaeon]
MSAWIIVGLQWGDEGKGKIADHIAKDADIVVRYQGGNNAGHTVVVGDKVYKFHLLPSGILQKKQVMLGAGMVINPQGLIQEIETAQKNFDSINAVIDPRAQVIMPYHILLDEVVETKSGVGNIGTTKRGIGPCYADKASRTGIRIEDIIDEKRLEEKLKEILPTKKAILEKVYGVQDTLKLEDLLKEYVEYGKKIKPFMGDVSLLLDNALRNNKKILFEGAQGTFLDNDFGTYPFVTSSHPLAAHALVGVGLGPNVIDKVIGIAKAYTTRVGSGPFITEMNGSLEEELRTKGNEFGTTTGRPRRVGWLDLVQLRTARRLNNVSEIALTKLDVLSGLKEIKICTGYHKGETCLHDLPATIQELGKCEPDYLTLPGFDFNANEIKNYYELPQSARKYVEFIEHELNVPIKLIGIGAERMQLIKKV